MAGLPKMPPRALPLAAEPPTCRCGAALTADAPIAVLDRTPGRKEP